MRKLLLAKPLFLLAAFAIVMALPVTAFAAATITIVNVDGPGEGFNDPTRAKKVGNNPGKTIGEQRLIAFQFAADIWGATLDSNVDIRIQASFDALSCTANAAVLGSAGAIQIVANFPGQQFANTWYHVALANKLAGTDLIPGSPGTSADDIRARFNSNLGQPNCLAGIGWYYGLDNNHGTQIDLVTVLLHEFAHGLGFSNFVDESTGQEPFPPGNLTDIYARFTFDNTLGTTWNQMNDPQRKASAVNSRNVVWVGQNVTAAVQQVLSLGTPFMFVNLPAAIAGRYNVGTASFGPQLTATGVRADVVLADDGSIATIPAGGIGTITDGCQAFVNAAAVSGKIALVDRGSCLFTIKVKNAQDAGATAVIVADNVAGSPPPGLGGTDPTITIPSVRITLDDGNAIKEQLGVGVNVTLRLDTATRAGADSNGRALLNAPDPVQLGSSISHWDPIAFPNQLMEPAINSDLTHSVVVPQDLTFELFEDIGW